MQALTIITKNEMRALHCHLDDFLLGCHSHQRPNLTLHEPLCVDVFLDHTTGREHHAFLHSVWTKLC